MGVVSKSSEIVSLGKSRKMKRKFFRVLARLNKSLLPSYTRKRLDLAKASKLQLALIGWRTWVTKNSLE